MTFSSGFPFGEKEFAELRRNATVVKCNPVREVLRSGKYFIKHDRRRNKSFRKEFDNALFLAERGIPVVRHLGYAESDEGNFLVTEALDNSIEVDAASHQGKIDAAFCDAYVDFINLLREKRLKHSDLHGGNVLYVPGKNMFALVDVKNVVRGFFPFYCDGDLQRLVTEIRLYLSRETIGEMLQKVGVRYPEDFFTRQLRADFRRVTHEWAKRRHQIMTGYRKFTRIDGHFILDHHADRDEMATARRLPAKKDFLFSYYFMQLIRIPTMRIIGYDLASNDLLLPPGCEYAPAPPERIADLMARLAVCGIRTRKEDWRMDHAGHTVLADWETVTRSLW